MDAFETAVPLLHLLLCTTDQPENRTTSTISLSRKEDLVIWKCVWFQKTHKVMVRKQKKCNSFLTKPIIGLYATGFRTEYNPALHVRYVDASAFRTFIYSVLSRSKQNNRRHRLVFILLALLPAPLKTELSENLYLVKAGHKKLLFTAFPLLCHFSCNIPELYIQFSICILTFVFLCDG